MTKYKNNWLGLTLAIALAFNTLLPFFALYSHNANTPVTAASLKLPSIFGEKVLICTGDGFALVNWKDLLAGKSPVKQHKSYSCALCYTSANVFGKLLLFASLIVFFWHKKAPGPSLLSLFRGIIRKPLARAASCPRAPPYSFA